MDIIFDIETDNLLPNVSKIWLLCLKETNYFNKGNAGTHAVKAYSDYDKDLPPLSAGLEVLSKAR